MSTNIKLGVNGAPKIGKIKSSSFPRPLTALSPDVPSHYKRFSEVRIGQLLVHENMLYLKVGDNNMVKQYMDHFKLLKGEEVKIGSNQQVIPCYFKKP